MTHRPLIHEVTSVETTGAVGAHSVVSPILADLEAIPGEISGELSKAKTKLGAALSWIEAHFTTKKLPVPTAPVAGIAVTTAVTANAPLAASMRQREAGATVADTRKVHRQIGELIGDQVDDIALALDAALHGDHAAARMMRRWRS